MRGLYTVLPTLSPDFCGVASALFELGGTVVIHDAGGCTGSYIGFDEPRWFERTSRVFTASLDEMEAVFGDETQLVNKVAEADASVRGAFIALVGSPVPAVLGTDYAALQQLIAQRTGKPVMSFATKGTEHYDRGVAEALLRLAKTFLPHERPPVVKHTVNLLGATPLDLTRQKNVDVIGSILETADVTVRSVWAMGSSLEDIVGSLAAQHNIALTSAALPLCRYLRQHYGMEFSVGSFSGEKACARYLERLKQSLTSETTPTSAAPVAGVAPATRKAPVAGAVSATRKAPVADAASLAGVAPATDKAPEPHTLPSPDAPDASRALVVGEQLIANGIREALEQDYGFDEVTVCTLFSADKCFQRPGDQDGCTEDGLAEHLTSGRYDLVVGDGLLRMLVEGQPSFRFVELPQVALSSRLGWTSRACPFGAGFDKMMEQESKAPAPEQPRVEEGARAREEGLTCA
jgi:hypothetical protein